MGVFGTALRSETVDGDVTTVKNGFWDIFSFGSTESTLANPKSALTLSAFFNGVDIISSDIAMLPKGVYRKIGDARERFSEHPVDYLISQSPSPMMTAFDFWKIIRLSTILKGNGFAEIVRNASTGLPEQLVFRGASDVEVLESEKLNKLYYSYKGRFIDGDDMLHFKGFSLDGKTGIGVVKFAAAQLGINLDSQGFASEVYKNKGITYGIVETEKVVEAKAKEALSKAFSKALSSKDPFRVAFLDEGFKYRHLAISPAEAQFLETNKTGVIECCRWLNIAPHKLKDLTNANYSNIYQQGTEHVQYTLMRWVVSDEQECNRKLFTAKETGNVYVKWNEKFLLRGDLEMKQKYYTAAIYSGYMNRNEVRALEDLNPVEGLEEFLQPVNMNTLDQVLQNLKESQNAGNQNK